MKINKVAPYEGNLVWVGATRTGVSKNGKEWSSVDFTLRYNDGKRDRHITFNAFGSDRVGLLMATPIEGRLRVTWEPDSHEYKGSWYTKLAALEIEAVEDEPRQRGTQLPDGAVLHPRTQAPTFPNATTVSDDDDEAGLPF